MTTPMTVPWLKSVWSDGSDGTLFDDRSNETLQFELGEGLDHHLPRGVELSLEKMKRQEKAEVTIRNQYSFANGWPEKGIAAGETLKYEIHLKRQEKAEVTIRNQ